MALDQPTMAALLLHMLHTREEKNIDDTALQYIEESLDQDELVSLFTNRTVKQIMEMIVKHFAAAIRKRKIAQKEAELLLHFAVMNFECTSKGEENIVKQCIIDTITQAIAQESGRRR